MYRFCEFHLNKNGIGLKKTNKKERGKTIMKNFRVMKRNGKTI
jgi:hypothetical protein